jgi:hypothetical protein
MLRLGEELFRPRFNFLPGAVGSAGKSTDEVGGGVTGGGTTAGVGLVLVRAVGAEGKSAGGVTGWRGASGAA